MDLRVEGTCNTKRYCRPPWLVDKEKILFYAKNHWGERGGGAGGSPPRTPRCLWAKVFFVFTLSYKLFIPSS